MLGIIANDKNHKIIKDAQRILYHARMHTLILSPEDLSLSFAYPLRGLVILHPETIPDLEGTVNNLRERFPSLPLALFYRKTNERGNLYTYRRLADFVYDDNVEANALIDDLFSAYEERGGKTPARIVGGLFMERDRKYANIYGFATPYTQIEWMLLYYLLQIHPRAASVSELAAVCFQPGHEINERNVVSRISQINCKTKEYFPACKMIEHVRGIGYRLHG